MVVGRGVSFGCWLPGECLNASLWRLGPLQDALHSNATVPRTCWESRKAARGFPRLALYAGCWAMVARDVVERVQVETSVMPPLNGKVGVRRY